MRDKFIDTRYGYRYAGKEAGNVWVRLCTDVGCLNAYYKLIL